MIRMAFCSRLVLPNSQNNCCLLPSARELAPEQGSLHNGKKIPFNTKELQRENCCLGGQEMLVRTGQKPAPP